MACASTAAVWIADLPAGATVTVDVPTVEAHPGVVCGWADLRASAPGDTRPRVWWVVLPDGDPDLAAAGGPDEDTAPRDVFGLAYDVDVVGVWDDAAGAFAPGTVTVEAHNPDRVTPAGQTARPGWSAAALEAALAAWAARHAGRRDVTFHYSAG